MNHKKRKLFLVLLLACSSCCFAKQISFQVVQNNNNNNLNIIKDNTCFADDCLISELLGKGCVATNPDISGKKSEGMLEYNLIVDRHEQLFAISNKLINKINNVLES